MEERKKRLPAGIENFELLRKEDFYYVDKTGLIADIMNNWGSVNLFTRPRRFGKTLNMSMLKSFFEIGGDKGIFDGLAICRDTALCEKYMGRYPVVSISLRGVDGLTFEDAYDMLAEIIRQEASRLRFLLDSDALEDYEKQPLRNIIWRREAPSDIRNSLKIMSYLLEKHYGQKTIILIDEYDVPLDKAYEHGYYDQMIDLIRAMLGAALKTNDSLYFAVLTGYLKLSNESIFTGLNNFLVHSISNVNFDKYFGFTDGEVGEMLSYYGLEEFHDQIREWYGGYRLGAQKMYCPGDVISYCYALRDNREAEPKLYWFNTSWNDTVRRLIEKSSNATTQWEIERFIEGEVIMKTLNENLTHGEIDDSIENIWSLLYMTGYLTFTERPSGMRYKLRIPNKEIRQIYMQQVLAWFRDKTAAETDKLTVLYAAFEKGDTDTIADYLNEQLLDTVSFYDAHESFYHGFLLALLNTCSAWTASSNTETGKGRSDIIVMRKDRKIGFVVEVKDIKDEDRLEAECGAAMRQIEDNDYAAILRRYRVKEIWAYGIAFCGKECKVTAKRMQ